MAARPFSSAPSCGASGFGVVFFGSALLAGCPPEEKDSSGAESVADSPMDSTGGATDETGATDSTTGTDSDTAPTETGPATQYWYSDTGGFVDVAASFYHRCALGGSGEVQCWGSRKFGKIDAPAGPFVQVSVGRTSSCAVGEDGTPVCWGCEDDGHEYGFQIDNGHCDAPAIQVAGLSCSDLFTVAVSAPDASLTGWSEEYVASTLDLSPDSWPENLDAVAAGAVGACVLFLDGSLACYSSWEGFGEVIPAEAPGPYERISAGSSGVCAQSPTDQTWTCWLGDGIPLDPGSDPYAALDVGYDSLCAVRAADGGLVCLGLLEGDVPPDGVFTAVGVADVYACAVRDDGVVACWGDLSAVEDRGTVTE